METSFHPSLANYPLPLFTPLSLGVSPSLTQTCHSSSWRHGSNISLCCFLYYCAVAFGLGVKVTGVYLASFLLETLHD